MRRVAVFLFASALSAAAPASAQDENRVSFNIGGGYTVSLSEVRKHLGDGFNLDFGVTVGITPVLAVQIEYAFNGLGGKRVQLPVSPSPAGAGTDQPLTGDASMQSGDLNLVFKPKTAGRVKPYLVAGMGAYYRPVKVSTPGGGYFVPGVCIPSWYVCYPGGYVPVSSVVGERSSSDFGIDIGGGFNLRVSDFASIYLEARYHYMWGPEVTDEAGQSYGRANGQFLPITFGIRF